MNAGTILATLPPYRAKVKTLAKNQDTNDIVSGMLKHHVIYAADYDKISNYFVGSTPAATLKNVWQFLKKNVKYVIEPDSRQTLKSPAAIVATGNTTGSDCKNYALFTAGIAHSLTRKGIQKIPVAYRFASYKWYDETPQHVFVVAYPKSANEIWIDPVLSRFNEKKEYNHSIDKQMALVGISGTNQNQISGIKEIFQKAKTGVLKVAAAPSRAAFLTAVSLNVLKVAEKLRKVQTKSPANLQKWWQNLGGNYAKLVEVIDKGMSRKNVGMIGFEPTSTTAIITAATPVIVALISLLKKENIDAYELEGAANAGVNERASAAAEIIVDDIEKKNDQYVTGENFVKPQISTNMILIGGAAIVAIMLMRKK